MKKLLPVLLVIILLFSATLSSTVASAECFGNYFFLRFLGITTLMRNHSPEVKKMDLKETLYDSGLDALNELYDGENIMISPLSLIEASAMMMNGAGGDTKKELENYIGDTDSLIKDLGKYNAENQNELKIANSMWLNIELKDAFLKKNKEQLNAEIYNEVNSVKINGWVDKKTDGMIEEIVDSSVDSMPSVLINALSFEAKWENQFQGEYYKHDFKDLKGNKKATDFMFFGDDRDYIASEKAEGFIKYYAFDENNEIINYQESEKLFPNTGRFKFMAVLPKDEKEFNSYVKSIDYKEINALMNSKEKYKKDNLEIEMPAFSSEYKASLKKIFKKNGVKKAFDGNEADFKKMYEGKNNLYIDDILQKTFVKVDKSGTKAAAATSIIFGVTSKPPQDIVTHRVVLDRPFIYIILDRFNNPVFIGIQTSI